MSAIIRLPLANAGPDSKLSTCSAATTKHAASAMPDLSMALCRARAIDLSESSLQDIDTAVVDGVRK
eukprot:CAMPEP_0197713486 /NCGR_PEP_ID=MMETSP1338-20131121/130482_1 /TAXON_ID=43686 ORGANISM="Pelagodinium beii, Strain RCC1491" /NCGR_SAMPLE_ID=MMETSP1338 /ASSEMBLY_ACC=CAM_ASM_000754 /LENGTH=66 /DNA_ID=CAMNT_0043297427 /DNA_START=1343 /DNA_END=1543 /DNA_ORIENTATION=+